MLLTVLLKHDQAKNLEDIQGHMKKVDWWERFPVDGVDFLLAQGFADQAGDGQPLDTGKVLRMQGGGKHDHGLPPVRRQLLVGFENLEAVHHGHVHVEQNQDRAGGGGGRRQHVREDVQGFGTVFGHQQLVGDGEFFEQQLVEVVAGGVVIDEQNGGELLHGNGKRR